MAAGAVHLCNMGSVTGNEATLNGVTGSGAAAAGFVPWAAISAIAVDCSVEGDVHGMLVFPFADPDTLQGAVSANDAKTMQISMTQGGAGAVLAYIAEELYEY